MIRLRADTRRVVRVTAVAGFASFSDLAGVFLRGAGSTGAGIRTVLVEIAFAAFGF